MIDLHDVVDYLADVSLLWPGLLLTLVVAAVIGEWLGRHAGRGRWTGTLLVLALGLIISATLTPSREALRFGALGSGVCDLSRMGLAPLSDVLSLGDAGFNIFLYLPLGAALGLLPWRRESWSWWAFGLLLAPGIELIQLVVRPLDRACQASDVIDNLTGLVIAAIVVLGLRGVTRLWSWGQDGRSASPAEPPSIGDG